MPRPTYNIYGVNTKGIDLPQYPNSAWHFYSEKPQDESELDENALYSSVAAVYRVANMSAEAIGSMPFAIMKGSEEVDTSDDYHNVLGFFKNPKELLRLWRLSLFVDNTAYALVDGTRNTIDSIRYLAASTITPKVDSEKGLIGFERRVGTKKYFYEIYDNPLDNQIFWMHRLDHTTEVEPSQNTELKALSLAAGTLYYSDEHIKHFFMRGGIKPHMLMLKGNTSPENAEKIEKTWDKIINGVYKFMGKLFQGVGPEGGLEAIPIGEGVEVLKDVELHRGKIEDIAMAAGMPLSLLLANSANYATANVEYATWFNHSVIPWAEFMQECMNELMFEPLGYRFEFRPEITNMGTEEEKERAGAYAALVASNVLPSVAAQMLGYELPPDYTDYVMLDEDYFDMMERKATYTMSGNLGMPEIATPKPPKDQVRPDVAKPDDPGKSLPAPALTLDQLSELNLWRDFAFRKFRRDESLSFPFVARELDEHTASVIRERLPRCETEDDIKRAFDLTANPIASKSEILTLADALNRLVDQTMIEQPQPVEAEL